MNKVILVGRLTRDPDLRYPASNVPVASFTIAVDRPFLNQQGAREADFIQVTVWRKQAENVKKYTTKGSLVSVEGRIQTRSYVASDNSKKYVTEVIADSVRFLSTGRAGASNQGYSENVQNNNNNYNEVSNDMYQQSPYDFDNSMPSVDTSGDPYMDFGDSIEITDDLPF